MLDHPNNLFKCLIGPDFSLEREPVGDYFINFRPPARVKRVHDENGIPMANKGKYGLQYNWTVVPQRALRHFQYWLDRKEESDWDIFIRTADFCSDALQELTDYGAGWYYQYPRENYVPIPAPRISGMAQGNGISVLVRAFAFTGNEKYIEQADRAFDLLITEISKGGSRVTTPSGNWWFEERPGGDVIPFTLNGFIYALFGITDIYQATGRQKYLAAIHKGTAALSEMLYKFDRYYWSLYDLAPYPKIARRSYHACHINQLKAISYIVRDDSFLRMAQKWERQYRSRFFSGLHRFLYAANRVGVINYHYGYQETFRRFLNKLFSGKFLPINR